MAGYILVADDIRKINHSIDWRRKLGDNKLQTDTFKASLRQINRDAPGIT